MGAFSEARTYAQFLRGFPRYLRNPTTLAQARTALRTRLERRAENLLEVAERFYFGHPTSPYLPLLEAAGCTLGDFKALVHDVGVEAALSELREAGVYFTFEEYKGRAPVVRNGREYPVSEAQFDNPFARHFYKSSTSGSTGRASVTSTGLAHLVQQTELRMLLLHAHGALDLPYMVWRPALPSGSGLNNLLRMARMNRPVTRWFTPLISEDYKPGLKYSAATAAAVLTGRACGSRLVFPEPVTLANAEPIVEALVSEVGRSGGVTISTTVSCGLRIALSARDSGLSLAGVNLFVAGEPPTEAKVRGMRESGATVFSDYGATETGRISLGCADPTEDTDMHVATDSAAFVLFPRLIPSSGETVHSIHITALIPSMPKLFLNQELDDFGEMSERTCGCELGALGLSTHIKRVRSFRKLVGEGVTLIGSDMVRILEDVLPQRFGGTPLNYQLVEDEDGRGFTRLSLHVSPTVPIEDESEVVEVIHQELDRTSVAAGMARAHWSAAETFRVVRREPLASSRGKQAPLRRA